LRQQTGTAGEDLGDDALASFYADAVAANRVLLDNGEEAYSPQGAMRFWAARDAGRRSWPDASRARARFPPA
jgi:hypothetical protein